jgi:hypothetical protein
LVTVSKLILGVDFLSANNLLVDIFSRQVLDSKAMTPVAPSASAPNQSQFPAALCHLAPVVPNLLHPSFPSIVGNESGTPQPLY